MKKLIFTFAALGAAWLSQAQTPVPQSVALVTKQTGCWCVNCGQWGWSLGHDLYSSVAASGKGIFMAVYDNSGGVYGPVDLVVPADGIFNQNFFTSGVPNFYVNGVGDPNNTQDPSWSSYTSSSAALAAVNSFASAAPQASPAAVYAIAGNMITSTGKAQFWSAATGTYYMASYIVEDSVLAAQYPIASGATAVHVGVLRASMTASSFWGEQIATGSIAANTTANTSYSATLDPNWNVDHLRIFTVIWKQNGNKYEFVNAAVSTPGDPSSVDNLVNMEDLTIFPNPASDQVTVSLSAKTSMNLNIRVADALGREVYTSGNLSVSPGQNQFTIATGRFPGGLYQVVLTSGQSQMTRTFAITK